MSAPQEVPFYHVCILWAPGASYCWSFYLYQETDLYLTPLPLPASCCILSPCTHPFTHSSHEWPKMVSFASCEPLVPDCRQMYLARPHLCGHAQTGASLFPVFQTDRVKVWWRIKKNLFFKTSIGWTSNTYFSVVDTSLWREWGGGVAWLLPTRQDQGAARHSLTYCCGCFGVKDGGELRWVK